MAEYKPNSRKSKEEAKELPEKVVKPVVSGKTSTRSNNVRKVTNLFVSEDASNIKSYILMDVLVPTVKKAIVDTVEMIIYGESRSKRSNNQPNYVPYRSYSDDRSSRSNIFSSRFDYDDIIFSSRGDAEYVLSNMMKIVKEYGMVTVADFYELSNVTAPYTAANYGWMGLRTAEVRRVNGGYVLKLPTPMAID